MEKTLTISEVSRRYGVSARMLRYYEKAGLFTSKSREGYAYRTYDGEAVGRLEKVLLLRKLDLSLREIKALLSGSPPVGKAVLGYRMGAMAAELSRLEKARCLLAGLFEKGMEILPDLQEELSALPSPGSLLKETVGSGGEARVLLLPPFRAAAFHVVGPEPEERAGAIASEFVQKSGLYAAKPAARMFGFNHPNPGVERSIHPTHSAAASGKLAHLLTVGHQMDDVAVGPHSPFMLLPVYGGKLLFIGDILHACTFMHGIEEIVHPPFLRRVQQAFVVNGEERLYWGNDNFGWGAEFQRIADILEEPDMKRGQLLAAPSYLIDSRALLAAGLARMRAEPYYFVTDISRWI